MQRTSLSRALVGVAIATGLLLLVPAVAMRFTREVSWGPGDFLAAGALLFTAGVAIVLANRRIRSPLRAGMALAAIGLIAALAWAELAVGLFR